MLPLGFVLYAISGDSEGNQQEEICLYFSHRKCDGVQTRYMSHKCLPKIIITKVRVLFYEGCQNSSLIL